ncbi:MAG: flagellar biosynthesis protein FliQ [Hyphomicrobiales bacterium]|nr:flagellar biosynthesis protein FliQ [Hyphomicrobiales bacterium]
MDDVMVLEIGRQAMFVTLRLAGPLMIVALVTGLIVAVFQALTTIQEMTLTFVPKIVSMFFALIVLLPFMVITLVDFSHELFDRMIALG